MESKEKMKKDEMADALLFLDPVSQKYAVNRMIDHNRFGFFSGGVEDGESMEEGILREVIEESGLYDFLYVEKIGEALCHFYASLKKVKSCCICYMSSRNIKKYRFKTY